MVKISMNTDTLSIGFIGQGWIGKHYADDFESRGYKTVRYGLEEPYVNNKKQIKDCDITLIAVPTPTTPTGFDDSHLRDALTNIGKGKIAVIKSTTLPGTTAKLQKLFPDIMVLHSPEFLRERHAAEDASKPNRNLIGLPLSTKVYLEAAKKVLAVLPKAPYEQVMTSMESELVKYAGNCFLYTKVAFMNVLFDLVEKSGGDFEVVRQALIHDPRIGESHTTPVHISGHDSDNSTAKRGAGGHCFIKDFEAFRNFYQDQIGADLAHEMLTAMASYNNSLLTNTHKDIDLLRGVYGDSLTIA
jgi:UDPglucose 6-dehydrogenase